VSLEITTTPTGARIVGELDLATAPELKEFLSQVPHPDDRLEVDISGLSFMDSSGLEVFLRQAASRTDDAPLVLVKPSRTVQRVFEIAVPGGVQGLRLEPDGVQGLEMKG
jgi:anti-anti-sigma factor